MKSFLCSLYVWSASQDEVCLLKIASLGQNGAYSTIFIFLNMIFIWPALKHEEGETTTESHSHSFNFIQSALN